MIGTGVAGSTAAARCRRGGLRVAVIDSRPFGGTCALRGCDPKKVLVEAARLADRADRMRAFGVSRGVTLDWDSLVHFKRSFTEPVPGQREDDLRGQGIETWHGRARFVGPTALEVDGVTLDGEHVIVATGAVPRPLGIPGQELLATAETFLDLDELPERILFVGGGYISFELAHVAARAGAQVTILHRSDRPLGRFDADLVKRLVGATRDAGIRVELETEVESLSRTDDELHVVAHAGDDLQTFAADLVVHGAGRTPDLDDLDLLAGGIERDARGITVNGYLQSVTNPHVYVVGDASSSGRPLTPVAALEGEVAAENLLEGNHRPVDYTGVPTVLFTIPPLASVGLDERTARDLGLRFDLEEDDASRWFSTRSMGADLAAFKVLVDPEGHLLGAHLLGPHADQVINVFAMAMRLGITVDDLKRVTWAYPTPFSDVPHMI